MPLPILSSVQVEFLGTDLAMPINGQFLPISGYPLLLQDIEQLILTSPGERVNNPLYGCLLNARIWENIDTIASQGAIDITNALNEFEPRITLLSVQPTVYRDEGLLMFQIQFIVNLTNSPLNFVLPFKPNSELIAQY